MRVHNVYEDEEGESHFRDIDITWKEISPGDVLLVEDTTGKGHLSQSIEGKVRHAVFIPLD